MCETEWFNVREVLRYIWFPFGVEVNFTRKGEVRCGGYGGEELVGVTLT